MAETEKSSSSSSSSEIVAQKDDSKEPKHLFSLLFPKFEPKFPFFKEGKIKQADSKMADKEEPKITPPPLPAVVEGENEKPNIASFPNNPPIIPPPLDVELQESSGRTHNPVVIWQVYALGGFIILKWIWARWKERNERAKKASSDDNQSTDEYQSPADDE